MPKVLTTVTHGDISSPATFGGVKFEHHDSLIVNHVLTIDQEATLGDWPKAGGTPALEIKKGGVLMVLKNLTICGDVKAKAGQFKKFYHSPGVTIAFDSSREPDGKPYTLKFHKPFFSLGVDLHYGPRGEIVSASHGKPVVLHGEHNHVASFKEVAGEHHEHAEPSLWMKFKSAFRLWA